MASRLQAALEHFSSDITGLARQLTLRQRLFMVGVMVGLSSGVAAFAFAQAIQALWTLTIERLPAQAGLARWAGLLILPAAGAFAAAALIDLFCPQARGHGVAEVVEALRERGGLIPGSVAATKLVASALTIGLGGSAGREGPVIQIGGSVGSWLGRRLSLAGDDLKTLVAAGAAAGLGAAFGTPLAAVFFTMEALLSDFAGEAFPAVVIASVCGTAAATVLMGRSELSPALSYHWGGPAELPYYVLVGLLCGACGSFYMGAVRRVELALEDRAPARLTPALGGLGVGLLACALPEVLGTGTPVIAGCLTGQIGARKAVLLAAGKIAATIMTLGTGAPGGAFMPAMFIGSAAGSGCRTVVRPLGCEAGPGALALAGMASAVTAAYRAPMTGIVLALELSRDYELLMPVMAACAAAYLVAPRRSARPVLQQ